MNELQCHGVVSARADAAHGFHMFAGGVVVLAGLMATWAAGSSPLYLGLLLGGGFTFARGFLRL